LPQKPVAAAKISGVERIVISDRTMARILALLPAVVVAIAVRVLTLRQPPLAARLGAAAAIALASWVAYRLLTARVVVGDAGVEVRGVLYEGELRWSDLEAVETGPAPRAIRALVWGVMKPHGLVLRGRTRTLRPIAAVCHADDEDLMRALGAIRVRLGAWGVPVQRTEPDPVTAA
jgi:hypothetical protein